MTVGEPGSIKLTGSPLLQKHRHPHIRRQAALYGLLPLLGPLGGASFQSGGHPASKEYMADEIGVGDGEIIASSKGLHLYEYSWDLARVVARIP